MSSFVYDALTPPDGKTNARNLVGPAAQSVTAEEWNAVMQYLEDIRTAIISGDYSGLTDYEAPVSAAGAARLRVFDNALQASVNGRAYVGIVPGKGTYTASDIGVLPANTPTQNSDAIDAWIAALPPNTGGTLIFDATATGEFYDFLRTITLTKPITLKSAAPGGRSVYSTYIRFPANTIGIQINSFNPTPPYGRGDCVRIEDLTIVGLGYSGATSGDGIKMLGHASVINCWITNFGGNGISIPASSGDGNNANGWYLERVAVVENKGHGLYVDGADANAGLALLVDASSNLGHGIYDSSFLGNTYVGCHTDANAAGSYVVDDVNARCMFLGCYVEGGQPLPALSPSNSAWIGGLAEGQWTGGGSFVMRDGIIEKTITRAAGNGQYSNASHITFGSTNGEGNQDYLRMAHVTKGGVNLRMAISGDPVYETYSPDYTVAGLWVAGLGHTNKSRFVYGAAHIFPKVSGFFNGDCRWDSGGTPDGTSTYYKHYAVGDIRWVESPVAGGTVAHICTVHGNVGTYSEGRTVTSVGTNVLTLSAATADVLHKGDRLLINGADVTITSISGTTLTVSGAVTAGSGLAIAYVAPTFVRLIATGGAGDSTGTPGSATLNTIKGRSALAAGANSVVVTNSLVTTTSIITATLQGIDATTTRVLAVVPASGSFTVYFDANATAALNFCWSIDE